MNPEIQKKIDCVAELVRQRDAIDRELAEMFGVTIGIDMGVGESVTVEREFEVSKPETPAATVSDDRAPKRKKVDYDRAAVEADIRAGILKPSTIAGKHGIGIAMVYYIKNNMVKLGPGDPQPKYGKQSEAFADDGRWRARGGCARGGRRGR
jgi:hypothetical protein